MLQTLSVTSLIKSENYINEWFFINIIEKNKLQSMQFQTCTYTWVKIICTCMYKYVILCNIIYHQCTLLKPMNWKNELFPLLRLSLSFSLTFRKTANCFQQMYWAVVTWWIWHKLNYIYFADYWFKSMMNYYSRFQMSIYLKLVVWFSVFWNIMPNNWNPHISYTCTIENVPFCTLFDIN